MQNRMTCRRFKKCEVKHETSKKICFHPGLSFHCSPSGFATRGATVETPKKWGCKWKHQGLILGSGAEGLMPGKGL